MKKRILGMVLALCMLVAFVPYANAATVASGNAGFNVEWVLDDSGTVTVSGSGNMYNNLMLTISTYREATENVIIKNGVTSIGNNCFDNSTNMRNIEIPSSVKSVGVEAFGRCSNLRSIYLPDNITLIDSYAFYLCTSLTRISIPTNITLISKATFNGCTSLTTIYLPEGITTIEENAFAGCSALTDVFFAGSAEEWNNITIGKGNAYLTGATIHYNNAEGEYPYEISSLSLKSNSGEYITAVPENESCIVNIAITERLSRTERDYVFIALYDETEQLVGLNYIRADFSAAHGCEFGLNIPKQTESIKSIKSFIWNSFGDMTPLCEAREISLK